MFKVFHKNKIIGHTKLEFGDPPMRIAHGLFLPTEEFELYRSSHKPDDLQDGRMWLGFKVITAENVIMNCERPVSIIEYGAIDNPFETHITCPFITYSDYANLFPHHVESYESSF